MRVRMYGWFNGAMFPSERTVPLGYGSELWNSSPTVYESFDAVLASLRRKSPDATQEDALAEVFDSMLTDVIDAAGGVEGAYIRLGDSIGSAQNSYDLLPQFMKGSIYQDLSTVEARYALEEMLSWARTLGDRLKRKSFRQGKPSQGLIPAIADEVMRRRLLDAHDSLLRLGLKEARLLGNLSLHMQSSHRGSRFMCVTSRGELIIPFPDPVTRALDHRSELTYASERTGKEFADGLMQAIEQFMSELVLAFSDHAPERFKVK